MSRNRTKKREKAKSAREPLRERVWPLGVCAATVLLALCALPIVMWGNPYPDEATRYWILGGLATIVATTIIAALPFDVAGKLAGVLSRPPAAVFGAGIGVAAFVLSAAFAIFVFHRGPSTSDELAELWHARILLLGHWSLPVDPNREFFSLENVVDTGRWYSQFPIGGPLSLALGALLGVPWIVNPVLAGASATLFYRFARRAFGELQGRAAATLFCLSPMILSMSGTWMNHVPTLFLAVCAFAALMNWTESATFRKGALFAACIGLAIGGMATIRPLDAVVVTVTVGVFQLTVLRGAWLRARELGVQTVFGFVGAAPLFIANHATTGHALTFGYDMSWGAGHRVGFHTDPYGNAHTLRQAFEYAMTYVSELNMYAMAWPIPMILIAALGLFVARRGSRWDKLMIGFFAAQVAAYAAYWGDGEFLGPRFLFTALPALIVLLARVPFEVGEQFGPRPGRVAAALVIVCTTVAWGVPWPSYSAWGLARQARGTRQILKVDVARAVHDANVHDALVFVREPFGARLSRRLWGIGMLRSDAAQLLANRDACSVLSAVEAAERDTSLSPRGRAEAVGRASVPFVPGEANVPAVDRQIRISSLASVTPACAAELAMDKEPGTGAFGPALVLEPIGPSGHIDGDVIYAADLGARNDVLRGRFGSRTWYRLRVGRRPDGVLVGTLAKY